MKYSGLINIFPLVVFWGLTGWCGALTPGALGDSLYAHGHYPAAIREYQRALFKQSPDSLALYLKIGDAYQSQNNMVQAQWWYEKAMDHTQGQPGCVPAAIRLAGLALQGGKPAQARYELGPLEPFPLSGETKDQAGFLRAISYLYEFACDSALSYLDRLPATSAYQDAAQKISEQTRVFMDTPIRNPYTALVFSSLVPGTGQIYAGDIKAGIKSLLLNGALVSLLAYRGYSGYQARLTDKKQEFKIAVMDFTVIFTGLFMRYYQAGRRRAYNLAAEYNTRIEDKFLKDIARWAPGRTNHKLTW